MVADIRTRSRAGDDMSVFANDTSSTHLSIQYSWCDAENTWKWRSVGIHMVLMCQKTKILHIRKAITASSSSFVHSTTREQQGLRRKLSRAIVKDPVFLVWAW